MPGITKEQKIKFIQKYNDTFDEEVLVDEGFFKGCKVKDADRQMVENMKQSSAVEWLVAYIDRQTAAGNEFMLREFYDDPKYVFLAIRHHFSCEGMAIIERFKNVTLPGKLDVYNAWEHYAKARGYDF